MTVDARHLNFNGGCHGGAIFALADSAFGLASNSHGPVAVGHRRAHHLPGGGRAPATRWSRAPSKSQRSRRIGVYRIDVVREEADGGETAGLELHRTVYVKG